jgi:iron only hydrogenase large subunit-like protein
METDCVLCVCVGGGGARAEAEEKDEHRAARMYNFRVNYGH